MTPRAFCRTLLATLLATLLGLAGCSTLRPMDALPDERFGSRVEGTDEEGRETLIIAAPAGERTWATYPAVFETVTVRPEPLSASGEPVAVEILVKGAFPDACTELHEVTQDRTANLVEVTLSMRREQGAVCAAVLRPYRFYLLLEARYAPGAYSLKVNDRPFPFEIRAPQVN